MKDQPIEKLIAAGDHAAVVARIIADQAPLEPEEVDLAKSLEDHGLDSLDAVELVMAFEEEYDISIEDEDAEEWRTPQDIVNYLNGRFPSSNG